METFSDRFAQLLADHGWSPEEAARHLPVSAVAVRGWAATSGVRPVVDPRATHLLAICEVFQVRPEWLMRGELPRERIAIDMSWPFITPRERIEALPVLVKSLLDRILFDIVEMLAPQK